MMRECVVSVPVHHDDGMMHVQACMGHAQHMHVSTTPLHGFHACMHVHCLGHAWRWRSARQHSDTVVAKCRRGRTLMARTKIPVWACKSWAQRMVTSASSPGTLSASGRRATSLSLAQASQASAAVRRETTASARRVAGCGWERWCPR
eukprot:365428-Chlamydomonas_euryale.AAC.25